MAEHSSVGCVAEDNYLGKASSVSTLTMASTLLPQLKFSTVTQMCSINYLIKCLMLALMLNASRGTMPVFG